MESIAALPLWALALAIFLLRIFDVSMGTLRTLAIVEGRVVNSVVFGFLEVLVWITAISQVVLRINESPVLPLAFAAGYAMGNAAGIVLERWLALGVCVLRIVSSERGEQIGAAFRAQGQALITIPGQGRAGPVALIQASCPRRRLARLIATARLIDPDLYFVVERANAWSPETPEERAAAINPAVAAAPATPARTRPSRRPAA